MQYSCCKLVTSNANVNKKLLAYCKIAFAWITPARENCTIMNFKLTSLNLPIVGHLCTDLNDTFVSLLHHRIYVFHKLLFLQSLTVAEIPIQIWDGLARENCMNLSDVFFLLQVNLPHYCSKNFAGMTMP